MQEPGILCKSTVSACAHVLYNRLPRRGWKCLNQQAGSFSSHFIQKENAGLGGEMLNLKVIHSLQSQGHHHYKKSSSLEFRLSGMRRCRNKTKVMKNGTVVPGLLSPNTYPEGGNLKWTVQYTNKQELFPSSFLWDLPENHVSFGKTKDSTRLAGLSATTLLFSQSTLKAYNLRKPPVLECLSVTSWPAQL